MSRLPQDYITQNTLGSKEDRVKLLKAGFSGRQIEVIYILLNRFEILEVNWQNTIQPDRVET